MCGRPDVGFDRSTPRARRVEEELCLTRPAVSLVLPKRCGHSPPSSMRRARGEKQTIHGPLSVRSFPPPSRREDLRQHGREVVALHLGGPQRLPSGLRPRWTRHWSRRVRVRRQIRALGRVVARPRDSKARTAALRARGRDSSSDASEGSCCWKHFHSKTWRCFERCGYHCETI